MLFEKYYEQIDSCHVNTCPDRAYYVPNSTACDIYMEESDRVTMLSDDNWCFRTYQSPYVVEEFFSQNYKLKNFDIIPVPSCWQTMGYDKNQYGNIEYMIPFNPPYVPDENLCGAYVKYFDMDDKKLSMKNYLNFEGVDSCYYVWINGKFVGFSSVSHSTSEFDVSDFLVKGINKLAVLVLKWCVGTYFEGQDKLRMSGIFRDVYIMSRPENHIRDFYIKTKDNNIQIFTDWNGTSTNTDVKLLDPYGNLIETKTLIEALTFNVKNPILWNAEKPLQYEIQFVNDYECICQKVGIKTFEVKGKVFYVNGANIKLKGVNRHDSDPFTGYSISREQLLTDLCLMKQHNINAIRTSHYPNSPWATRYFSELGFYVINESDIETHGATIYYNDMEDHDNYAPNSPFQQEYNFGILTRDPKFLDIYLDRTKKNVERDKNNACVIMWSLGNEAGYGINLEKSAAWIKSYDKDMLVHYEGSIHQKKGHHNDVSNLDVYSRMYMSVDMTEEVLNQPWLNKPFMQAEFLHAMGNGPGGTEDYFEQIYRNDCYLGGFV